MALPKAIQAEVDRATAIEQQLAQPAAPAADTSAPAANTEPATPADVPVEQPAEVAHQPDETPAQTESEDIYRRRYEALQGKFNAEVPRLTRQVQESERLIAQMQADLQALREKVKSEPEQPQQSSQKDVEEFGADLVAMVNRLAAEAATNAARRLEAKFREELAKVGSHVGTVTQQVEESKTNEFWGAVLHFVPDWDAVNSNPAWVAWLDTRAPGSLHTYRALAEEAIAQFNPEPVVELAKLWKSQQAPAAPAGKKPELQKQVSPPAARASGPAPDTAPVFTMKDVEQMGDPRFIARMSEAEYAQRSAAIDQALVEGRIRMS
jgi:uncharacterized coiled-coil protein SlyX